MQYNKQGGIQPYIYFLSLVQILIKGILHNTDTLCTVHENKDCTIRHSVKEGGKIRHT